MDATDQMDQLNAAAEAQNWDDWLAMFAPNATLWQNFAGSSTPEGAVARFKAMGIGVSYTNIRRVVTATATGTALIEEHDTGITIGGKSVTVPMCLVVHFDVNCLVTSVAEYADSKAFDQLGR